jgi:release factor glutamine methyltransferase
VAAATARRNLPSAPSHIGARVHEGDLYDPLPSGLRGRIDVLVANAPYVPTAAIPLMPPEAREHEPLLALDGGADGLDVQRRVIAEAPGWLAPGGWLLIETSEEQSPRTAALFEAAGFTTRVSRDDDLDATVVVGRMKGGRGTGRARTT